MSSSGAPSRSQTGWFSVGATSSFPDVGLVEGSLSEVRGCGADLKPGCKVFHVPRTDGLQISEVPIKSGEAALSDLGDLNEQVLVFQYRGKFHAIDHVS